LGLGCVGVARWPSLFVSLSDPRGPPTIPPVIDEDNAFEVPCRLVRSCLLTKPPTHPQRLPFVHFPRSGTTSAWVPVTHLPCLAETSTPRGPPSWRSCWCIPTPAFASAFAPMAFFFFSLVPEYFSFSPQFPAFPFEKVSYSLTPRPPPGRIRPPRNTREF